MVSRIQLLPVPCFTPVADQRHSGAKFGMLSNAQLQRYNKALGYGAVAKSPKPGKTDPLIDLGDIHDHYLSSVEQERLEELCNRITPEEVAALKAKDKLGVLSPTADILLGLYTLKALCSGWASQRG